MADKIFKKVGIVGFQNKMMKEEMLREKMDEQRKSWMEGSFLSSTDPNCRSPLDMFNSNITISDAASPVKAENFSPRRTQFPATEKKGRLQPVMQKPRRLEKPRGRLFNTKDERRYNSKNG